MGRTKKEIDPSVKKKTFRFDDEMQGVFDSIAIVVGSKVPTKYVQRLPSEQEVMEYILRDYWRMSQAGFSVLAGPDEG